LQKISKIIAKHLQNLVIMADLKQFRKQNNLTQDELGEYLGIKKSFISRIENGFHKLPQEKLSKLLENDLGWNVSALLTSNESEEVYSTSSGFESIVPAEVVAEIKEEVAQEVAIAESVPILSEDLTTATDINIRSYIEENGDELERINPSQMLQQADLAEKVMRASMLPTFAPGDIVFIRFMKDKAKLIDGDTYYFDLKSLPTMIRKVKFEGDNKLRLIAQNPAYADIVTEEQTS
jgi:transcriptional regulator with XRE-family HTH domain